MEPGDVETVLAAADLFDGPPRRDATEHFLAQPTHHLLLAFDDRGDAAGFVSGVETTHPDKGTEMFLYELAVDEPARRQGIGKALVSALAELARARGCYGMWVLTDDDNRAGYRTYESAGGHDDGGRHVLFSWEFPSPAT
jgi:ribosomal protein S18 acetylase RimI-like enzyme